MISKPRGLCLIINNKNFEHPDPQKRHQMLRRGSEHDVENLNVLFQTLEFEVHIKNDLKKDQMFEELEKFSQKPEHKSANMCIVAVMSHGEEGCITTTDNQKVVVPK